jgi:aromatic ring hydroxylase-like protein
VSQVDISRDGVTRSGHYEAPLVLVRPDQHVAWRGGDDAYPDAVLDRVRGAAATAASAR